MWFYVLVGVIIKQLLERYQGLKTDKFIRNGLIFSLLFFTLITSVKTRSRINVERSWPLKETVLHKDLEFLKWNTWYDRSRYEILEDPNFNLENLGVSKNDYVICLGDKTINRSLYLVNRLGYTSFNVDLANAAQFIEEKKKIGLKYLILIEPDWINDETLKPHMKNKIYEYKSTSVYRL